MSDIIVCSDHELLCDGVTYRCAIGANGFTDTPREGAKATPIGSFALRECRYRADRIPTPETGLPLKIIQPDDGWCDDPEDSHYNRPITLPYSASHETLWREDGIYDIVVPIGFNDAPVVAGRGSAIFFHLANPDFTPTLGCIAVAKKDMILILKTCTLASMVHIMMKK